MATLKFPERLLQPFKNLRQFQQELYAMHRQARDEPPPAGPAPAPTRKPVPAAGPGPTEPSYQAPPLPPPRPRPRPGDSAPAPASGTARKQSHAVEPRGLETRVVTERRREAGQAPSLTLPSRDRRRPEPSRDAPARKPARPEPERQRRQAQAVGDEPRRSASQAPGPGSTPAGPVKPRRPDDTRPEATLIHPRQPFVGGGGGTTTFLGKVVSGTGDTYQVTLYPDGPLGTAGDQVEVKVPFIVADDTIPAGTWINPVFEFPSPPDEFGNPQSGSVYSCQVPVWMP